MKILFYDIKEHEYIYLNENPVDWVNYYFESESLQEKSQIKNEYKEVEGLSVFVNSTLNRAVLSNFSNLKFIFLRSTGYSNVDLKYCKNRGISVFNVPNYGISTVAEFTFALILNISKKLNLADREVINGSINNKDLIGTELKGKTLGIVGLGSIGKKVYNIAKCFDMEVIAYDKNKETGYNYCEFDELLKNSDYISINCPLTNETKHLINKETINKMKTGAYIINTARGEIIEVESLYKAIIEGKIKGAALDVIECEESLCALFNTCSSETHLREVCAKKYLFVKKLFSLPNVIITPHIAYNTIEAGQRIIETTHENIKSSLNINSDTKNLVI